MYGPNNHDTCSGFHDAVGDMPTAVPIRPLAFAEHRQSRGPARPACYGQRHMTTLGNSDPGQSLSQTQETVTAIALLSKGIAALEKPDNGLDADHIMLQSLASGFERLLKVVLIFRALQTSGKVSARPWPSRVKGHDVDALLDLVVNRCYAPAFYTRQAPSILQDAQFLSSDPILRELMRILAHYGLEGRYHDMDAALGQPQGSQSSPADEIDQLVLETIKRDIPDWAKRISDVGKSMEMEKAARRRLAAKCRRAARALARLFTLSPLSPVASPLTSVIGPFLFLRDEDL